MKKLNTISKVKKFSLLFILAAGVTVFLSFTRQQQAHSKANLEVMEEGDDDEPLSSSCGGTERWSEKVFTDANAGSIDFAHPHNTGVTHLVGLPTVTPTSSNARIQPQEDSVYTVIVTIKEYRPESDSDSHLVITDGTSNTMVAEVPDPGCSSVAASPKVSNFIVCHDWVLKNLGTTINTSVNIPKVVITGVSFYDPPHGQSGAAPNNMELHSVIDIHFYSPTGIDQVVDKGSAVVYPNPSNGLFNVNVNKDGRSTIEVYNMIGEQVYTGTLENGSNRVNMMGRATGVYFYKVLSEEGDVMSSGKMLIK